jgi:hypothetical protein
MTLESLLQAHSGVDWFKSLIQEGIWSVLRRNYGRLNYHLGFCSRLGVYWGLSSGLALFRDHILFLAHVILILPLFLFLF